MRESGSHDLSSPHALLWRILRLLGALSLIATAFVLLARAWWFFELFAHFRIQLFAAQLLLLIALLVMRRPLWATLIGVACVLNGLAVRDYVLPAATFVPDDAPPAEIRVLNANVRSSNTNLAALVEMVIATEPDIIAVIEFSDHAAAAFEALHDAYPHRMLIPQSGNFGIAVFSRRAFAETRMFELSGYAAIDVRVADESGAWHFIAAHPVPPIGADMARLRNTQLEQLAEHIATLTAPHIVVGDLNLTPFAPQFRDFVDATRLSDALRGRGPTYTWPSFFPLLGIPIDHVLVSSEFEVVDYVRANDIGSDHFPVLVDINRNRIGLD